MSGPCFMTAVAMGQAFESGDLDPRDVTGEFLARIKASDTASDIYITRTPERARAEAAASWDRAKRGLRLSPLDGVPVSWKDLYDVAGTVTTAGSLLMTGNMKDRDAALVARGARAGLVCLGKTNLTEFAFSGLGINPHFGTPANPHDTATPRVPGGSSSGAAVSVARGLAVAGMGTDTGGSVRVPACYNGLVGLKTTLGSLPMDGVCPLSPSLDTLGPLTRDVGDAAALWSILSRTLPVDLAGTALRGRRFYLPTDIGWADLDPEIERLTRAATEVMARAGAVLVEGPVPEYAELVDLIMTHGGISNTEGYAIWGETLESAPDRVYHNILSRFRGAQKFSGVGAERTRLGLARLQAAYLARTAGFDAVVMPTCPIPAPAIQPLLDDDKAYTVANFASLRNTRLGNYLALCGLTLPCGRTSGGLPAGLMLNAPPGRERFVLRLGRAIEVALEAAGI